MYAFGLPKWRPKASKPDQNQHQNGPQTDTFPSIIFYGFLKEFPMNFMMPGSMKTSKKHVFLRVFEGFSPDRNYRKTPPKRIKIYENTAISAPIFIIISVSIFASIFDVILVAFGTQMAPQITSKLVRKPIKKHIGKTRRKRS